MKVAVFGLGIIGSRAAANLRQDPDLEVAVWNRSPGKDPDQAPDIASAAREAEVVALYLKDGPAVREVVDALAFRAGDRLVAMTSPPPAGWRKPAPPTAGASSTRRSPAAARPPRPARWSITSPGRHR